MTVQLDLPREILELLGKEPERRLLEAMLLQLVKEGEITLSYAGKLLGLNYHEVIEWYVAHGYPYFDMTPEELERDYEAASGLRR